MRHIDQAVQLRRLVRTVLPAPVGPRVPPPRLLVVSGARCGAGATTLAVHLSIALANRGRRCVLVDADLDRADIAARCGTVVRADLTDVLTARRDVREVLQAGPAGIQLLPGAPSANAPTPYREAGLQRVLRQLHGLAGHAEAIVVDVGSGMCEVARRFWSAADRIVLVMTTEPSALLNGYANIKRGFQRRNAAGLSLTVNRVTSRGGGERASRLLDGACRQFLGFAVDDLGEIPEDAAVAAAAVVGRPLALHAPGVVAASALESVAGRLDDWIESTAGADRTSVAVRSAWERENFEPLASVAAGFGR